MDRVTWTRELVQRLTKNCVVFLGYRSNQKVHDKGGVFEKTHPYTGIGHSWLPTLAIAGGNAAGGGVRSVSVDFFGLEIALLTGLWLVSRRS